MDDIPIESVFPETPDSSLDKLPGSPQLKKKSDLHIPQQKIDTSETLSVNQTKHRWEHMDTHQFIPPHTPLERPVTKHIDPGHSIDKYRENPFECSEEYKNTIFREFKSEQEIFDLINKVTHDNTIDLQNKKCVQVVTDVIHRGERQLICSLMDTLSKNETVNLSFLKHCFKAFKERDEQSGIHLELLYPLEVLFKIYDRLYLSTSDEDIVSTELPVNDPSVVEAFCILLNKKHNNDDKIRELLGKIIHKLEFDTKTFIAFLSVYKKKEEEKQIHNIEYPARSLLLEYYESSSYLQKSLNRDPRYQLYLAYIQRWLSARA